MTNASRVNSFETIVGRALAFFNRHLTDPISLQSLSQEAGYSPRHVQRAFHAVLGESALAHLSRLRIEKAKRMLAQTNLPIIEVALETGHSSHTYFGALFRRKTGLTPSQYRQNMRQTRPDTENRAGLLPGNRRWFEDALTARELGTEWHIVQGEWEPDEQGLHGRGYGLTMIHFQKTLPENFRLRIEFRFEARDDMPASDFVLQLHDENRRKDYSAFNVGAMENHAAEIRRLGIRKAWEPSGKIKPGQWQVAEFEQKNEYTHLFLDGARLFRFRDPFPPPHSSRCKLTISTWRSSMVLRNMVIENLGYSPYMSSIGRGDTLYALGQYSQAMGFYRQLSQAADLSTDTTEISYKIGMCYLGLRAFREARECFAQLAESQSINFWAQQARLGMVETDWQQADWVEFRKGIHAAWPNKALRHEARVICELAFTDLENRGFLEQAAELAEFLYNHEADNDIGKTVTGVNLAQKLVALRNWNRAEQVLQQVCGSHFAMLSSFQVLMELYAQTGRVDLTGQAIRQIEERTRSPNDLYNCAVYSALGLRTLGKFDEAADALAAIARKFPEIVRKNTHALLQQSLLLAMLGKTKQAFDILGKASQLNPGTRASLKAGGSIFLYMPYLVDGDFGKAAEVFSAEPRSKTAVSAPNAMYQIKAAIFHELAGDMEVSRTLFDDAARRFAYPYINFYGGFAQALAGDQPGKSQDMPAPAHIRCEMFYLAGLLNESRGDRERARELFKMAVEEDPRNYAPAWLAKQKLTDDA